MTTMKTCILKLLFIKKLKSSDLEILRSKSLWLNDKIIDAGMEMLKSTYPQVKGIQDCIMSDTLNFQSVKGDFELCKKSLDLCFHIWLSIW